MDVGYIYGKSYSEYVGNHVFYIDSFSRINSYDVLIRTTLEPYHIGKLKGNLDWLIKPTGSLTGPEEATVKYLDKLNIIDTLINGYQDSLFANTYILSSSTLVDMQYDDRRGLAVLRFNINGLDDVAAYNRAVGINLMACKRYLSGYVSSITNSYVPLEAKSAARELIANKYQDFPHDTNTPPQSFGINDDRLIYIDRMLNEYHRYLALISKINIAKMEGIDISIPA